MMVKGATKVGRWGPFRSAAWVLALFFALFVAAGEAFAFPDVEIDWTYAGEPPFSFGISGTPSGFDLWSDTELAVSYSKTLQLIDTGAYADEATQPFDISSDTDTDSVIKGIAYVSSAAEIVASQEDGVLLVFPMSDVSAKPTFVTLAEGNELGPIAVDSANRTVYVADNSSRVIHVVDLVGLTVTSSIALTVPGKTSFSVTDAMYVEGTANEAYFTTDVGGVFYIASGGTAATLIDVDVVNEVDLVALDALPSGSEIYVVNSSDSEVRKIDTSAHTVNSEVIDMSPNSDLSDIAITEVTNPTSTYAYVAGVSGVSVINTATDTVLDLGSDPDVDNEPIPTSAQPYLLQASSVTDGFVYCLFSTGSFGVISENPFVEISSLTYSSGGSSLGQGESITLVFAADQDGTWEVRVGGSVDESGTLLADSSGATSGAITADTDTSVTFNYDDNSSAFPEGTDDLWVFVTNGDVRGRRSTQVSVDTPPPDVVISSTGFGNQKVYINFERIDVEDMATYNIYADTDPSAVLTKSDVSATVSQPSSGTTVSGAVEGLTNGTVYYFAMEAVDAGGNLSPNRTNTYADGTPVTGTPQATEGPAGASGERGCTMGGGGGRVALVGLVLVGLLAAAAAFMKRRKSALASLLMLAALLVPQLAFAQDTGTEQLAEPDAVLEGNIPPGYDIMKINPPRWTIEAKTGFWMPSSSALDPFYGKCCNMWTRFQVGHLWQEKYGVEMGIGFHYKSGKAVGTTSGTTSQDSYSFLLIPIEISGVWRADYWPNFRYIIPYLKFGPTGIIFRENASGRSVKGIKWGLQGAGGVQLNIGMIGDARKSLQTIGIRDFFFTLEGQYQYVNNFGGKGLNLSGPIFSFGFLFYL